MTTAEHRDTAPPAAPTPPDAAAGRPTGCILLADRLCVRCGFNLAMRPIVRESRYDLLVVRCPHCGQLAPVEEFPPLTRWTARWTMLIAATWMLLLIVLALGSIGALTGMTFGFVAEGTDAYDNRLHEPYQAWYTQRFPDADDWTSRFNPTQFRAYWATHGRELLAAHPPFTAGIEWDEISLLVIPAGSALVLGGFWSLALLQWRRRPLVVATWVLTVPALAVLGVVWWLVSAAPLTSTEHVAWTVLRMPLIMAVVPVIAILFSLGVLFGRAAARGLVRALLPPSLRGAMAFLWTADGRPAPAPPGPKLPGARPAELGP